MRWLHKRISYRLVLSVDICIIGIQNADYVSNASNQMSMLFIDDQSVWTCTRKKRLPDDYPNVQSGTYIYLTYLNPGTMVSNANAIHHYEIFIDW